MRRDPEITGEDVEAPSDKLDFDCSAVIADIWLLLDNECDPQARARLQQHLDECPPCLAHYGLEEKIRHLLARKCGGERAPESLRERLRLEIHSITLRRDGC
jgi:mycothiol system anti-sigma-R factor